MGSDIGSPGLEVPARRDLATRIRAFLPTGGVLPDEVWWNRHRAILKLLWLHVPGVFFFALLRGEHLQHGVLEAAIVGVFPATAQFLKMRRRWSTVVVSVGLMVSSAVIVHLSGGMIEAHFHFFVMVGVVVLYQDWWPFLIAIAFVVLHHGIMGALFPEGVYNHPGAWRDPWAWAAVHGGAILAMSATGIATWRLTEANAKDLAEARDKALEVARMKSSFLANMSHELRTPMNGVIGMSELLLETDLDARQQEYLQTVRHSSESLLTILNDILDFSKMEAGKLDIEVIDFDLRSVTEDVADLLAGGAHAKGLELVTAIDEAVPSAVRGDPGRVRQVLTNLVGNAVKFTESGQVVISAKVETVEEGRFVRFQVDDTGIGIAAEKRVEVFEPFSQADGATTRRFGGTGLGLAITRQLVSLMGGRCGVESALGVGSSFWFTIPLELAHHPVSRPSADHSHLQNANVLVVDDNATNRAVLEGFMRGWAVNGRTTGSGASALELLRAAARRSDPFSVVLIDMQMPAMDGLQLARAISGDPLIAGVKMVLLTSSGDDSDARTAQDAGMSAYLAKPVRRARLQSCLAAVLGPDATAGRNSFVTAESLETRPSTRKGHVLLAEDNEVNQAVAVAMLEGAGYRVHTAVNGIEVLRATAERDYNLILMDSQMPEMDGYEATQALRAREGTDRHTPIVALTAAAMKEDRERCLAAGMDDYLAKPFRKADLLEMVVRWAGTPVSPLSS